PVLQALWRALRGLRGQAGVPRVRRRGTRAPRPAASRVSCAARAPETAAPTDAHPPGVRPVIDLHTHTTASDGRCTPAELVARASAAGVTVLSVTDHDTVAACEAASAACRSAGIEYVAGIEVTAVRESADVHMLGYFIDSRSPSLLTFLADQ